MKRPQVNRPLIFAHRGACKVAPENTLPAFLAAIELGADGVELDVQYSSDGHLVVMHNPSLDATTDGSGRVTSHTFEELQALDAGSWFDPRFAGTRIPALDEVLELLRGKLLVNIELKALDMSTQGIGADAAAAVRDHDMADQVVLSSFNPFALRRAKRAGPNIECALLLAPDLPAWTRWRLTRWYGKVDAVHPELPMVDEAYVEKARKRHLPVRVWTVNEDADMRRMIALDVDAMITDEPDRLKAILTF
jgi:glycerophosphoryl diester phosphodiesterase